MSIDGLATVRPRARAIAASLAALGALSIGGCYAEVYGGSYISTAPPRPAVVVYDDEDPICLDTFQPALTPYGAWVEDDAYGLIWVPSTAIVGVGFTPFLSHGRWAYTSEGYVFVSEHPWGWVTYHYGRWVYSTVYGWVWVPGARYSPAWVEWRYGGGYIGWAPMRPMWRWRGHVAYLAPVPPPAPFMFVSTTAFFSPQVSLFVAPPTMHATLFAMTRRWIAPPAATFYGPPPKVAGIPRSHVGRAKIAPPPQPKTVPWGTPLRIKP
jgi:hypothetical protein